MKWSWKLNKIIPILPLVDGSAWPTFKVSEDLSFTFVIGLTATGLNCGVNSVDASLTWLEVIIAAFVELFVAWGKFVIKQLGLFRRSLSGDPFYTKNKMFAQSTQAKYLFLYNMHSVSFQFESKRWVQ